MISKVKVYHNLLWTCKHHNHEELLFIGNRNWNVTYCDTSFEISRLIAPAFDTPYCDMSFESSKLIALLWIAPAFNQPSKQRFANNDKKLLNWTPLQSARAQPPPTNQITAKSVKSNFNFLSLRIFVPFGSEFIDEVAHWGVKKGNNV